MPPPRTVSSFCFLSLFLFLSLIPFLTAQSTKPTPSPLPSDCPELRDTGCMPSLRFFPELYEVCKTQTCFLFLHEPPYIIFPVREFTATNKSLVTPFNCGDPKSFHPEMSGLAFRLHNATSTKDSPCIWAGNLEECSFNDLVDFAALTADEGYMFAITGLLLHTPRRMCHLVPSAAYLDDDMVVIGRVLAEQSSSYIVQLVRPFSAPTWAVFGVFFFTLVAVSFYIAFGWHGRRSLLGAIFVFAGERNDFLGPGVVDMSFITRYGIAITTFRVALVVLVGLFFLFYQVSVVNFLFQAVTAEIGKHVTNLSAKELKQYSVLKGSALETVWNGTVNADGSKFLPGPENIPWSRCDSGPGCVEWVSDDDHPVSFDITFRLTARYLIPIISSCNRVAIFNTKDVLYQFNGGWLYNRNVKEDFRKRTDREIVALRIDGTIPRFVDELLGSSSCEEEVRPNVSAMIILIPILLLVFPPLLASVLVMFFWKKKFFKTWARMDLPRGYTLNKFGNADARENQKGAQKADGKEEP